MRIEEILDSFRARSQAWAQERPLSPDELASQLRTLTALRARVMALGRPGARPQQATVESALVRLNNAHGDLAALNRREIGALCTHLPTAQQPDFLRSVVRLPTFEGRTSWLAGLIECYAQGWGSLPDARVFEATLRASLDAYAGRNRWLWTLRGVAQELFAAEAPEWLAERAIDHRHSCVQVLEALGLSTAGGLAGAAQEALGMTWARRFRQQCEGVAGTEAGSLEMLNYCLSAVVGARLDRGATHAFEAAVGSRWGESEAYRTQLRKFVLTSPLLGDPRLAANSAKWASLRPEARERVMSWLARESVQFFFERLLPPRHENRARGEFWLRYHQRIVDFRVAVSEADQRRLEALKGLETLPEYSRTDHASTSAFLMQLAGTEQLVVVEFSETGNAAYVYSARHFLERTRSLHRARFRFPGDLKSKDLALERILHHDGWQATARSMLARLGVRP